MAKSKHREELMKKHHHKYVRHYTNEGYYCFYCGDPAEGLDHVPPLSLIDAMPYEKRKRAKIPAVLLACCGECNNALNSRRLVNVDERLEFLESFYDAKFKKQNSMWTEEEILELGPSLQNSVRAKQEQLQRYIHKIRNIQRRYRLVETHPTWEPDQEEEDKLKKAQQGV
jgi:hypothetical protein